MPTHETISGHRIEYETPMGELAQFLQRVRQAMDDPTVTEDDMIVLLYSPENPLLTPGVLPDRGMVTKETLANPLYAVLQDLLFRKRIAERGIDLESVAARHTISVPEAAARLGVHVSTIKQAVDTRRLPSWLKDGRAFFTPESLDAFELAKRGPKAKGRPLRFCAGNVPGQSFRVKAPAHEVLEKKGRTVTAEIPEWSKVAVISGGGGDHRFFELEPVASGSQRLAHGRFYVQGPFKVARKINNAREADREWKAFEPA